MGFDFTPAQMRAITDRDGAVLVSAAAGSGKTRVLTERLAAYVTDPKNPADIDRFLVITYTRAAAAELQDRITQTLSSRLSANPEDKRLRRQQFLVSRAPIGTIHSFCASLLRENCHALGLPPRFTVLEEERAETLRRNVLTKLLDGRYDSLEADPAFRQLVDTVGAGTDDRLLELAVLQLHDKLRSQPQPRRWAETQRRAFYAEGLTDAGETPWGRELLAEARRRVSHWLHSLEAAIDEMEAADPAIQENYASRFAEVTAQLRTLLACISQGWDSTAAACRVRFPKLGQLRNYENLPLKERMQAVWNGCKKACGELEALFDERSEALLGELRALAPAMERLLDLTLELDAAFSAEKLRRGGLDYADLEHGALRLLRDGETGERTALARETAERFVEILVDEYQDVSPVQESILTALSR
ncbi:MAG: UvrD-helicase domain-containing protein, partial [Oscillospiraceae bacterium]|nr:UvrD-helicase domain-containing protein [Oscillospiraceae bacterium]